MYLILITYKKTMAEVEKYLTAHREFLEQGYQKDFFVVSGPRNPRTGGIIISQLTHRKQLEQIIANDPFVVHDVADYEIVEFSPVKYHKNFAPFISL